MKRAIRYEKHIQGKKHIEPIYIIDPHLKRNWLSFCSEKQKDTFLYWAFYAQLLLAKEVADIPDPSIFINKRNKIEESTIIL